MRITVSSKGQVRLLPGPRQYQAARHPKSGLPVRVALKPPKRKVTAAEIARLHAELV